MSVNLPSEEELLHAIREFHAAGPGQEDTVTLGMMALGIPVLHDLMSRYALGAVRSLDIPEHKVNHVAVMVMGCIMTGMNIGLRIGEQRVNKVLETR
jgi:hypothetical protein